MNIQDVHKKHLDEDIRFYLLHQDNKPAKLITIKSDWNGFHHYIEDGEEKTRIFPEWLIFNTKQELINYWKTQRTSSICQTM